MTDLQFCKIIEDWFGCDDSYNRQITFILDVLKLLNHRRRVYDENDGPFYFPSDEELDKEKEIEKYFNNNFDIEVFGIMSLVRQGLLTRGLSDNVYLSELGDQFLKFCEGKSIEQLNHLMIYGV